MISSALQQTTSVMDYELSGSTDMLSNNSLAIPDQQSMYITFVVLVYQLVSTAYIIGMDSLIISTILKNRSLHNVHNILIVNLMVADILGIAIQTFASTVMMVLYIIGIQDPFRCDVLNFFHFPLIVIMYTFVMISVDKFIAIKYALRYKAIVTHRRVCQAISAGWITALSINFTRLAYEMIVGVEYDKSSQFGFCSPKQVSYLLPFFTSIIPVVLTFFITITLDIYLSIKAYQMYKKIQKENGEEKQMSKDKLNKFFRELKPLITLLVTILGTTTIPVILTIIYVLTRTVKKISFLEHVIFPNSGYLVLSLHSLVYGLYFKKIRQPLCRKIKRMARSFKFATSISPSQAPNGRSTRIAWM